MRILIAGTIVLMLIVAAILLWPVDHTPTLPDTGPGAHVSAPVDGGGAASKVRQIVDASTR